MVAEQKDKNWQELIKAYSLKNAIEHEGKCQASAVLNSMFHEGLEKARIKEIMPLINASASEINKLNIEEQKKLFAGLEKETDKRSTREGLRELENAEKGKVITRLAPEPSKYLHIGHALTYILNYRYAKKYKGKCKLRFEDCNPEKVSEEFIKENLDDIKNYLAIKPVSIRYVSDDMKKLYKYAEKLIKLNKAYMCFCAQEKLKELRGKGIECSCREYGTKKNLAEWKKFLKGEYKNNKATLRIKGNMQSTNYVMRDSVLFRYIEKEHFKYKKYKIWPMFDFYNPIEDHLMNVTHILRSNEFDVRVELQDYIKELLGLHKETILQYGRFNISGAVTQGREVRKLVESGQYIGWDDPRLATLKSLKRRGITKEALYELAESIGLKKNQIEISFDMLASINRKLIDKKAERFSFIQNPVKLNIKNKPDIKEVEVKIHPEKQEKRKILIQDIFISENDYKNNIGKEIRLMHLFNIKLKKNNEADFTSIENKDINKINWISYFIPVKIFMPDGTWLSGVGEIALEKLKPNAIIQFERFAFVRLDKINSAGELEFWFSHK